jgi:hypothetical protein
MKSTSRQIGMLLGLWGALWLSAGMVRAQEPTRTQGPSATESSSAEEALPPEAEAPRYVLLLNSDRLVAMNETLRYRFLYGMSLTQGYDDGILPSPKPTGVGYTLFNPQVGFLGRGRKIEYALQYAPTVAFYSRSAIGTHAYHQGDIRVRGDFTRRWGWDFQVGSNYGAYTVSLLSPYRFSAISNIPVVNVSTILQDTTGDRLDVDASVGLRWLASPRNHVGFIGTYNYVAFSRTGQIVAAPTAAFNNHTNRGTLTTSLDHVLTRRLTLSASLSATHTYGLVPCTYYGGMGGFALHATQRIDVGFTVGPQFGDPVCTASRIITYHGWGTFQTGRNWSAYLTADRSVYAPIHSVGNLNQIGLDQVSETYSAGLARRAMTEHLEVRLDGGYIHSFSGNKATNIPIFSVNGKFISPQVGWAFTRSLVAKATYRRIYQVNNALSLDRNQSFVTLEWRPEPRGLGGR